MTREARSMLLESLPAPKSVEIGERKLSKEMREGECLARDCEMAWNLVNNACSYSVLEIYFRIRVFVSRAR